MTPGETAGPLGGPGGGSPEVRALVAAALAEDVGDGDRTTLWTVPAEATGRARILARAEGVLAGREPADLTFRELDASLRVTWERDYGESLRPGEVIARLEGSLRPMITGERTALNFLARLSGIATLAARFVAAVEGTGCRVADTRKTIPGWRALEKRAAVAGGAINHRSGLYDMVLIKENHIRAAGGIGHAMGAVRQKARREGLEVEVEVATLEELEEALAKEPDRILLDNMGLPDLREAVRRARAAGAPPPLLEASGGVTLDTVRPVAETGVELVSVGAITHSAPALDLTLLVDP